MSAAGLPPPQASLSRFARLLGRLAVARCVVSPANWALLLLVCPQLQQEQDFDEMEKWLKDAVNVVA